MVDLKPGYARNAGPAKWAIGIVLKPDVNAIDVEDMAAIGYDPELLVLLKLGQAHRALAEAFGSESLAATVFLELENWD